VCTTFTIRVVGTDGRPGDLVRRAAGGDEGAWLELVDEFSNLVWSVARAHRLREADAADVSQTVWLRLVEHLGRISDPDRIAGWLLVTTRRECLRALRWSARVDVTDDPEPDHVDVSSASPNLTEGLEARERADALWVAVDALPNRCHLLVRFLLLDPPPTYEAIAEALEVPIGSIGPTRARCFEKLRLSLEDAGISSPPAGSA
jgi:RNA polymerase sigma factor (sigma-70 family)